MPDHNADAPTPVRRAPRGSTRRGLARRKVPRLHPHRRVVIRVIAITNVILALVTAVAVSGVYYSLSGNIVVDPPFKHVAPEPDDAGPTRALNILVLGSDTRDGEGNSIDGESGEGGSDTTILVHISKDRKDVYGVSLPRDALVDRPACETAGGKTVPAASLAMFNTAFALGGQRCTRDMVESLTGIFIDYYVVVDFNGFKNMVDAVDGVTVCIPKKVDDPEHDIFFDAGTQTLTGTQALNYVRERYVLSLTGDIGRMKRQQAFIASMINKVLSAKTLSQPAKVVSFLSAATKSLTVSSDLQNIGDLADLALQFRKTGLAKIKFITVPFEEYEPDPNRLVWAPSAADLWKRINNDKPLGAEFVDGSISAADPIGTPSGGASPSGSPSASPSAQPSSPSADESTAAEQEQAAEQAAANGLCA